LAGNGDLTTLTDFWNEASAKRRFARKWISSELSRSARVRTNGVSAAATRDPSLASAPHKLRDRCREIPRQSARAHHTFNGNDHTLKFIHQMDERGFKWE
jgi:hypothetical protein